MSTQRRISKLCLVAAGLVLATQAGAQVMPRAESDLHALAVASPRLEQDHATAALAEARQELKAEADSGLDAFTAKAGGTWVAQVDRRTGRIAYVEGSGLPWFPGRGNSLRLQDVSRYLAGRATPDLAAYDRKAREFAPSVAGMLGFDPAALRLNLGRSGAPAPHVWFVDYDVLVGGRPVEGARVLFAVNSGNLVSVGTEHLPAAGSPAPRLVLPADKALDVVGQHIGGFFLDETWVDTGSYHVLPALAADARFDAGYESGNGRGLVGVWQFVFRRPGEVGTWRARVDAESGELVEFRDVNEYGSVTGGAYKGDRPAAETVMPMPFANYGSGLYANSAGLFSGTSGTTTLSGQYVGISDSCGAISKASDANGLIAMGSGTGTDCTTPGSGGAGNTHAARTQYYMVNRAKEVGRGWLPSNTWLAGKLTANVNLNQTCNAYWNGSTLNFFKSGGGCSNTGELPGVSLHEWGHGLDTNDGSGSSADNGTGETYGDTSAFLATHNSCIGNGFLSSNCGGYGNACTSCTGVRDVDYAKHSNATASNVDNFTRALCPTSTNYKGPCGREGHCESLVSSQALWDLAARDLPGAGTGRAWTVLDRLWYLSRATATKAFQCTTTATPWTANGCFTGSYFRSMRTVDDDNGNLTDGTPHGGAIANAFNRHGIACTTDTGWNVTFAATTPPAAPALSVTAGSNSAALSWSGSTGVYDVYRNETGCNAGFIKVANDLSTTSYTDSAVANGFTYYYQVVAQPSGNEAAASAPSTCQSVTPTGGTCTPPAAPTGVTATSSSQTGASVSWTASGSATSYTIFRSTTSGSGYAQVGTSTTTSFADSGLACGTTYYYVVTASNGTCSSGNSAQASAATSACTGNVLTNGVPVTGLAGATGNEQNWTMAVPAGATNLSFQISGGTGDADLYVRFGAPPTTTTYDCRPYLNGNAETCSFATPQTGTYYVMIRAYATYSGVSLVGSYSVACTPPAAPTGVTASSSSQTAATVSWTAASGATSYKILRSTTSGSGYAQVGTSTTTSFSNTGLACGTTYYYVVRSSNGTCDSGNSAQASATTSACSGGSELLTNGAFETAITPWVLSGNAYYIANGSYPHGGTGYAYLGNVNSANGNTYQQITIPTGTAPSLTFWLNVVSTETTTTIQYDKLYVEVTNTSGTVLATLATFSNLNKGTAGVYSQKGPYSLSAYAGQTVRIRFRGTTDSSLITTFRIDDASAR